MIYKNKTLIFYKYLIIYNRGKNMKGLNKTIITYIVSAVFFTLFAVGLTVVLTLNLINNNIRNTYIENGVIVDLEPKVTKRLEKQSNVDGLKNVGNRIVITNNGENIKKYKLLLTPLSDNEKEIRVSLNKQLIRILEYFDKEDGAYVLYGGELASGYSAVYEVGMWLSDDSELNNLSVDFKINVKIIDE